MRKLIRKILREQEEEEFVFPKYDPIKKIFNHLDKKLKGLVKEKSVYYDGIVFAYPDKKYGILGWESNGTLYIPYELIDEIATEFDTYDDDVESLIKKWVIDRFQLEVNEVKLLSSKSHIRLAIDYN
jgi:hypothetical protein